MPDVSLPSGINKEGRYIHISQTPGGLSDLQCPYCGGQLIARKGQVMAHHFAHVSDTCLDVTKRDFRELDVPLYEYFRSFIAARAWQELSRFHETNGASGLRRVLLDHDPPLIYEGFDWNRTYQLTHEGKIPFGEATLSSFADFQSGKIVERHRQLYETVQYAYYGRPGWNIQPALDQYQAALADLNIYRAQVERLHRLDLYLLEIKHIDGTLYKIGVSTDVERRILEIERDLKPYITIKSIKLDRLCKNRGAVERYALHRYRANSYKIDQLTEYFSFDKQTLRAIRSDFTRLGDLAYMADQSEWLRSHILSHEDEEERFRHSPYISWITYSELIGQILAGCQSYIEDKIRVELEAQQRRQAIRDGMEAARGAGIHVGRPPEDAEYIISKYPEVVEALQAGEAIKSIAKRLPVSRNTVRKVRDALK